MKAIPASLVFLGLISSNVLSAQSLGDENAPESTALAKLSLARAIGGTAEKVDQFLKLN